MREHTPTQPDPVRYQHPSTKDAPVFITSCIRIVPYHPSQCVRLQRCCQTRHIKLRPIPHPGPNSQRRHRTGSETDPLVRDSVGKPESGLGPAGKL